ncbi:MAG: hypothetical protein ACTSV2_07600 [Candidatus Thorarchaeota archaeon]
MDMKRKGMLDIITDNRGNEKFLLDEIRDLSLKYGISESTVLEWLRDRKYPSLVDKLTSKPINDVSENDAQQNPMEQKLNDASILFKIKQWEIRSFQDLLDLIDEQLLGIKERDDFQSLLKNAEHHINLLLLVQNHSNFERKDIIAYAVLQNINKNTAVKWVFDGERPLLHKIMARAITKEEAAVIVSKYRLLLSGITNTAEVLKLLNRIYPNGEYKQSPQFLKRWDAVVEFFRFLDTLQRGGTIKGIAKRANVSSRRVREWVKLRLPWLIRHILPSIGQGQGQDSLVYAITITEPIIRGRPVKTFKQLLKIIEQEFPWLLERKDYPRLFDNARVFFKLVRKLKGKRSLLKQDIFSLGKELGVSHETARSWVMGVAQPMIFDIINNGLSVGEGNTLADELLSRLNGISNFKTYSRMMKWLYITELLKSHKYHDKESVRVRQYFRFIDALRRGGLHGDFAKRSGAPVSTTKTWILKKRTPRYLKYACSIPKTHPGRGKRWLPLTVKESGLEQFVSVPLKIKSERSIDEILEQLSPLSSKRMKTWRERYKGLAGSIAFMYLLGTIFSDGSFGRKKGTTTNVSLSASKKYNWSMAFGEAFCYCLGLLGIGSSRRKDRESTDKDGNRLVQRAWGSKMSSLLSYIRKSLFGLQETQTKNQDAVDMDWVFNLPLDLRLSLLRGIADGDGFASIRWFGAGICTKPNKIFIERLLSSLGINSRRYSNGLSVDLNEAIRRANEIEIFLSAVGKSERLSELVSMLDSMDRKKIQGKEKEIIIRLSNRGLSDGQITSILWAEHGIARRPTTIRGFLKRHGIN